ncbi:MAG: M56 family metallopeptidase, partial [Myxococcota bacterium]
MELALAWALLHSAWQGAVIAGLAGVALRLLHGAPAEARYRALGGLLAAQVGWFAATLWWLASPAATPTGPAALAAPAVVGATWPAWLVVSWGCGVALLGTRMGLGLYTTQRWRARSIPAPPAWAARFDALRERMGIDRAVALRLVPEGLGPMAVGLVRPVVLVPAGLLVQLPAEQLEAILLHELAHVRRLDWAVNLAQTVAETLLFHHPATWWLSSRIRHERELCCDALAARAVRDPLLYARALTELDALRVLPLAVAANGGHLMDRILRLVGAPQPPHRNPWVAPAVVLGLLLGGVSVAARGTPSEEADLLEGDALAADDEEAADELDRPTAAEDIGATVLDALADKLHEGARSLESKADARYRRKHPDAVAPVAP